MDSKHDFDYGMERAIQCWTENLAPANAVERRLVRSIARQDFLMCVAMKNAIETNEQPESAKYLRVQRDLGATLDSLIHALSTLQRQRLALEPPPAPAVKAKVVRFPKNRFEATIGRPGKLQLEPDAVPDITPFTRYSRFNLDRGERPSIDFKKAA